jgi:hypothetical protein
MTGQNKKTAISCSGVTHAEVCLGKRTNGVEAAQMTAAEMVT